jgi:flavin reductase (DIM6/NTAB) family NADH-FMN oxidoreductase RutF
MTATPLTATDFRHALGQFATGVTVVTAPRAPGQAYGMTANSFASVSLDALLILVCVDQRSHLLPLLKQNRFFGVNVLKEHQQPLSVYFAQLIKHRSPKQSSTFAFAGRQPASPSSKTPSLKSSAAW